MSFSLLYITRNANHHQLPMGAELAGRLAPGRFCFAAMEPMRAERVMQGWAVDSAALPSWVLFPYASAKANQEYRRWCETADVVISGVIDFDLFRRRMKLGKLTFYASERWLRIGFTGSAAKWAPGHLLRLVFGRWAGKSRLLAPKFAQRVRRIRQLSRNPLFHYLPMGAYAAEDMAYIGAFPTRVWNWGYFAAVPSLPPPVRANEVVRIMWAGRLLDWKQVDILLAAFAVAAKRGPVCRLQIIGLGPEKERLERLVDSLAIGEIVSFESPIPADEVRSRMRAADIYVLPSTETEGWGVVVNEALSEGCAVVACSSAGSARVLIEDGCNGLLFGEGDVGSLAKKLEQLICDAGLRVRLGRAAWESMRYRWTPAIGAERMISLCRALLANEAPPAFDSGPCQRLR